MIGSGKSYNGIRYTVTDYSGQPVMAAATPCKYPSSDKKISIIVPNLNQLNLFDLSKIGTQQLFLLKEL